MKIFKEILRLFENFWKVYGTFSENLGKNLENFGNMNSRTTEIIKKLVEKINGNLQNFENFHELWEYFYLKR